MISYEEALNKVMKNIKPLNSEELDISEAIFRYLFNDIYSPSDMPRFDNSSMDGYAIKSSDTIGANKRSPVVLRVVGVVKTGVKNNKMIKSGEALRISTGGRIPEGADAVVM
ncbi:MAG: molybdopterin molybdenumtransferase MoeA, partial [Deltaproteobacteria bacterium]|nr:molybdopterin molybdenumtransferase MoeA [Deltaproteobacteria bacterium]